MLVRIKPGLSHAHYSAGDVFDASPAEIEAFGDKFERVLPVPPAPLPPPPIVVSEETIGQTATVRQKVEATSKAAALAMEHGVDLAGVTGTGRDGRITLADVEAVLNGNAP